MGMPPLLPAPLTVPPDTSPDIAGLLANAGALFGRAPAIVSGTPDYTDDKKLLALATRLKDEAYDSRFIFERGWWRILLYALGRQWIYYDVQRGQWVDKRMAKWIPRPVTNKIGETINSYRSVFQSVQLVAKCRPNGQDPRNVTTAETADRLEPAIREEHDWDEIQTEADFWYITLGNVFLHTWWNPNDASGSLIPFERCLGCGQVSPPDEIEDANNLCPKCRQQMGFEKAIDLQTGKPIGARSGIGRGETDVLSPFEVALPPGYTMFRAISHLIRSRWRTKQYAESFYPPEIVKGLKFDKMPMDRSLQLLRSLATTSDAASSPLSFATSGTVSTLADGITEYELHLKPCRDYPDGLLLRWVGESSPRVVRLQDKDLPGPLPYHDSKGNPLFPWMHAGYERMGGRIWARSPMEPLLSKQDQINQVDSLTQLIVQRTANPVWLEPKGAEVKKFTGEPGLVIKYNPSVGGGNAKPDRIAGENIPVTLITLRQQLVSDLEALAGTSDVLKGQRPPNVEAFSALQLLVERSQSRFGPALAERGKLYREWYRFALELEREFGPKDRVFAVLGPNQSWTFEEFKKSDLSGDISVLIEDGSQTPKTSLGKRAAIEQLNQLGFLDKNDAEQRYNVFKTFGATDMLPSLDNDVKSALQEQDAFERWAMSDASEPLQMAPPMLPPAAPVGPAPDASLGTSENGDVTPQGGALPQDTMSATGVQPEQQFATPMPMNVQYWHRDDVHNAEHRKWANSDAARTIFAERPELIPVFTRHMQLHDLAAVSKAVQQAMISQGALPPAPGAQGVGQAFERSNKESGSTDDVPSGSGEGSQNRGPE